MNFLEKIYVLLHMQTFKSNLAYIPVYKNSHSQITKRLKIIEVNRWYDGTQPTLSV